MAVDPYSPCPCGSGQKFKWCCHKVEAYAERAQRQFENGQVDGAIEAVDEGLRKEPGNPWLLTRKAVYLLRKQQPEAAKDAVRAALRGKTKSLGAMMLLTRLVLETEGPTAGVAQFQQTMTAVSDEDRKRLVAQARVIGLLLSGQGNYPAGLAHLRLVQELNPEHASEAESSVRMIERSAGVSPWMKNPYRLSPAPQQLPASAAEQFAQALRWADEGLWSSAASAFELLSGEPAAEAAAERNLGLCRLWLAENDAAVAALRRSIAKLGSTTEAVDLEALCQQILPPDVDDLVEHVQLIWPLRDRDSLLKGLKADPTIQEEEPGPIDPEDEDSPEVQWFGLLDRPAITHRADLRPEEMPRYVGRVFVGQEIVGLDTYDDGRLDRLIDRFTSLASSAIAPAHPRTKVLEKVTRRALALSWEWFIPEGMEADALRRLNKEQGATLIRDTWPQTPMSDLGGKSPLDAARAGGFEVPLRAAVFQLEQSRDDWRDAVDFGALRSRLGIGPEPVPDPATVEIAELHLSRLGLIPIESLDDRRLVALYRQARRFGLTDVIEGTARALIARPDAWEREDVMPFELHADLASIGASRGDKEEAQEWVRRGRQADPAAKRAANAPLWDMTEIRIRAQLEPPEAWVPELAVVMDRYHDNPAANQTIVYSLIDMGLLQMVQNPDRPDELLLDPRPLQQLMSEYGPRVTTASGALGVAASRGEIWTPGASTGGGGGGLWTPGSPAPPTQPGGDKPRLIIPGR